MTCERETVRLFKPQFGPILLSLAIVLLLGGVKSTQAQWTTDTSTNNIYYNAGKVGIGTASPSTKLEVSGDIRITHGTGSLYFDTNSRLFSDGSYSIVTDLDGYPRFYFAKAAGDVGNSYYDLGNNSAAAHHFRSQLGGADLMVIKNGGNVGIGTTSPNSLFTLGSATPSITVDTSNGSDNKQLFLSGSGAFDSGRGAAIGLWGVNSSTAPGDVNIYAANSPGTINLFTGGQYRVKVLSNGNVGIGTTSPYTKLQVAGGDISIDADHAIRKAGDNSIIAYSSSLPGIAIGSGTATDQVIINSGGSERLRVLSNGNVGIGKPNPEVALDVIGDIQASGVIHAKYQDVAEWVPASEQLAAGTVVVLDSTKSNQVTSSSVSYDTRVAGVVSEQPGIALGEKSEGKVLVATTGRVRVKVDASRGPIHVGDLLVTSDMPGVAMKSEPVNLGGVTLHRPGTLIGKALEPLEKGKGEILVLLSLQ